MFGFHKKAKEPQGVAMPNVSLVEEKDPLFSDFVTTFQSSILRLGLIPGERGHVHFVLFHHGDKHWDVLPAGEMLASEYLLDLYNVSLLAMHWIAVNCTEEISDDGTHLYFKFKEQPN